MHRTFLLLLAIQCSFSSLCAQKKNTNNQYAFAMELGLGTSFPNISPENDLWSAGLYASGIFAVSLTKRFNQRWSGDFGLGFTSYFLTNRGPVDKYILDFASPHTSAGLTYTYWNRKGQESFIRLRGGLQMAYRGTLVDEFETYTVVINGDELFYYFVQPEIGIRRYFKRKMKGSRFKIAYEIAAFYNHRFNSLGTADILDVTQTIRLEPQGSILGASVRILFPQGNKKIRVKKRKSPRPPIIYHPRGMAKV